MSKDPAFLFYSKDFYEGTRMMLPEERACYIDLIIYQHQNGIIPNDLKRVLMYCSGVDEATLIATLKAKFKQTDIGWVNERLEKEVLERENFKNIQSLNGKIGQFWKKCASILSKKELSFYKSKIDKSLIIKKIDDFDFSNKNTLKGSFKRCLNIYANANEDVNVNKDEIEKGGSGEKTDLKLPWDTENFKAQWQHWKIFKRKEFKFEYKSLQSEQAALTELSNKSGGDEKTAIAIIQQSMANGWKGFFELKTKSNEQKQTNKSRVKYSDDFLRRIAEDLQS